MKQIIISADDLGICESTNHAIEEAFRRGILTSTSLMASGPAFEHAVEQVVRPNPKLAVQVSAP
ncbi:MAG: ChbG/HpnK family deacetylase [Planctomycetota bacterium]